MSIPLLLSLACAASLVSACQGTILSEEEQDKLSIAVETRWAIPPEVAAAGDQQDVSYTGAGAWHGSSSCAGGLLSGTAEFKNFILASFPQVSEVGGYNCRSIVGNSSRMSVHGTGRAIDIHIPTINGNADNAAGDPIGNWLIANAEAIGVQYIIWDRTQWTASRPDGSKSRRYGGAHPHNDHLHVELSPSGGLGNTDWFDGPHETPSTPSCETIEATGGVLETDSLCLHLNGPSRYWRSVDDAGNESSLVWTNAFQSDTPSNWAQFELQFAEANSYRVEVFLDPAYGKYNATRYRVNHGGETTNLVIDQSAGQGWTSLGNFAFSAGGGQSVSVFDNVSSAPGSNRSIMVDAVRFIPEP